MLKEYVMKSRKLYDKINFRDIEPELDFKFFSKVRSESSFFLDDARNFDENEVKVFLSKNRSNYQMVIIDGQPVGYLRLNIVNHEGNNVQSVGLDLAIKFRSKGFAIPIYKILFERLKTKNVPIVLWVLDFNTRARNLYSKLGFKEIKREKFIQIGSNRVCQKIMLKLLK